MSPYKNGPRYAKWDYVYDAITFAKANAQLVTIDCDITT